jgi:general secretion pathway protein G
MMRREHVRRMRAADRVGFTLIELLLVLVILTVLAAVVVPKFSSRPEQARIAAARADLATLDNVLSTFQIDTGRFPTNEEGLGALVQQPSGVRNWNGPYVKRGIPKDPWGNPYVYQYPGQHNGADPDLHSLGPDGREGNDDIDNWSQQ